MILLTRILGLTFLVLAFARPYIPGPLQNKGSQNQVLSIFIDNSFSMETLNKEGTLLDEAKRREMMDNSGQMGVPVIIIGDQIIVGFDESRIRELLGI